MKYFLICLALVAVICFVYIVFRKLRKTSVEKALDDISDNLTKNYLDMSRANGELSIRLAELPSTVKYDDSELVEIKDKGIIERIDAVVPGVAQVALNSKAAKGVRDVVKSGGIYQAVLPQGAVLCKSKEIEGAVRGFARDAKGITAQANLLPVDGVMKKAAVMNVANAAMNTASMVVGQYYMSQIDDKLEGISESISQLKEYQEAEFKSKVMALVARVHAMTEFRCESLEDDEIRKEEIAKIGLMENDCLQLLGQASIHLEAITKEKNLSFDKYESKVSEAASWYKYQQILLDVYGQIEELNFVLHQGRISRERSFTLDSTYRKQVNNIKTMLIDWHNHYSKEFGIDVVSQLRERTGFDKVIHYIPSCFDEKKKYTSLKKNTVQMITAQTADVPECQNDFCNHFDEDVRLIMKEGKVYYLPEKGIKDNEQ